MPVFIGAIKSNSNKKVLGFRKVLVVKGKEWVIEYWGDSLAEVLKANKSGKLYLRKYKQFDIGMQYDSEALVGDIKKGITREDYQKAYDKLY